MSSKKKGASSDTQTVEKLRAVVLADSFTKEFRPITLEIPRSLLPVVNIPLLEYTIEFLAGSGVQEVLVFSCSHSRLIQEYINNSKWKPGLNADFSVKCMQSRGCVSEGDAMREICELDIRNDFILVSGDVIANFDLRPIIQEHNERRAKDKSAMMTMIFKTMPPATRFTNSDSVFLAIAPDSKQLIQYEHQHNDNKKKDLSLSAELFTQYKSIQVCSDIVDCHIDICSPEVLLLFKDNFDFQSIREDFVKGVLNQEEIYGNKIFTHFITSEYASRVNSVRAYEIVSKEIVHRWSYPIVPDTNFTGSTTYKFARPNNYLEDNVSLSRTCTIGEDTVIGEGTEIGENTNITRTIIGRNVKIGKNVSIVGSFLWDNVVIEDGAVIDRSMVCSSARIKSKAKLSRGCIVSYNVVVGEGFVVPEHTRLTAAEEEEEEDDSEFGSDSESDGGHTHVASVESEVGKGGYGRKYIAHTSEKGSRFNLLGVPFSELVNNVESDEEPDTEPEEPEEPEEPAHHGQNIQQRRDQFMREVYDTVIRALQENHSIENSALEVNGLKFAYDASFEDCATGILGGILIFCDENYKTSKELLNAFKEKMTKKWKALLAKFVRNEEHQIELLFGLVDFCSNPKYSKVASVFPYIVQCLYDMDICEEEAILQWAADMEASTQPTEKKLIFLCKPFLDWLKEAEEEDSEEEDSD